MLNPNKWTLEQMAAFAWLGWCYWAFQRVRPGEDSQPAFDRLEDAMADVERIGPYPIQAGEGQA